MNISLQTTRKPHPYNTHLKVIKEYFPKASIDRSRGHEAHIRITNMDKDMYEQFLNIAKEKSLIIEGSIQDRRYSTAYKTTFITIGNDFVPFVLSNSEMKIKARDSLTQKQLTPKKLGILGKYNSAQEILDELKKSFTQIIPTLNSSWKSWNEAELKKILLKLAHQIVYQQQTFTKREQEILKEHCASIGKDFGEILSAIYIAHKYGNVEIERQEATANFDLSYVDQSGEVLHLNTKSGGGSGQSFTAFKQQLNTIDFNTQSDVNNAVAGKIMQNLCNTKITGREKVMLNAQTCRESNTSIAKVMNEISKKMFQGLEIKLENFKAPKSFAKYKEIIEKALIKQKLKVMGIPVGSRESSPDEFYSKSKTGAENAIVFTLATILANFYPSENVNFVMKKILKQSIFVLHLDISENGADFQIPETPDYRFHYWGNFKSPTNNLPGYKTVF